MSPFVVAQKEKIPSNKYKFSTGKLKFKSIENLKLRQNFEKFYLSIKMKILSAYPQLATETHLQREKERAKLVNIWQFIYLYSNKSDCSTQTKMQISTMLALLHGKFTIYIFTCIIKSAATRNEEAQHEKGGERKSGRNSEIICLLPHC